MREMDFRSVDLNLLVILRVLIDTRSVTRAAERLNMSQPAVSRALAKLRTQLGDALLVKGAGGMLPTLRAEALSEPLEVLLRQLEDFIAVPAFDPATSQRIFRIATTDYGAIAVLPRLMQTFDQEAPLAGVEIVPFSDEVFGQLSSGQLDLVLYSDDPVPGSLRTRPLFYETYTCLLRSGHPLLIKRPRGEGRKLTLDEFTAYPHALVSIFGGRTGLMDEALLAVGRKRNVVLWLPYFATASLVCASSNIITTLPTRLASALATCGDLALLDPPLSVEGFGYRMLWHERSHNDSGAIWLRDLVARSMG